VREHSNDNRTTFFYGPKGLIRREDFSLQDMDWLRVELEKRNITMLTPEECEENRLKTLQQHDPKEDLWIFGYSSLLWDPGIEVPQSRRSKIAGWRRSFCIDMLFARGSPKKPGLMLALDKGGECEGVAYCIPAKRIDTQTPILWRREMAPRTYRPAWIDIKIDDKPVAALAFVIDQDTHLYAGNLEPAIQARRIAKAEGPLGSNRAYLYQCEKELKHRGIQDEYIMDLAARTRALAQD
jgi:cation transport protein ChaC